MAYDRQSPTSTGGHLKPAVTLAFGNSRIKDLAGEVWSCNGLLGRYADRQFELHQRSYLRSIYGDCFAATIANTLCHAKTIWTWERWPEIPKSIQRRYPTVAIERSAALGKWHLSSLDWMMALAIHERIKRLRITGIQNMRGGEPIGALACLAYWLGLAEGRGMKIEILNCDGIGKTYQLLESERQYGREDVVLIEHHTATGRIG